MKSVLVTGGAGYIGSILVGQLLEDSSIKKVRVFDNLLFKKNFLERFNSNSKFELIYGDIRDYKELGKALNDVDHVIHLAGLVGDPACSVDIQKTIDINLLASKKLIEMCNEKAIKHFIFASTCSIYGASKEPVQLTEESKTAPISLYGETKKAVEEELLNKKLNFPFTILRFGTAYGPSDRMRYDLAINSFCQKAFKDKKIMIYGGDQWRPFVHAEDITRAVHHVLNSDTNLTKNQTFNVGNTSENYLLSEIGKLFEKNYPETEVLYLTDSKDARSYNVSFKKIESNLNFKTKFSVKEGIKQILALLQQGKFIDFDNDIYYNYKWS